MNQQKPVQKIRKLIQEIKYWWQWLTDGDFRYQMHVNKVTAEHSCYNCGDWDYQVGEMIGGLCDDCRREQMERDTREFKEYDGRGVYEPN